MSQLFLRRFNCSSAGAHLPLLKRKPNQKCNQSVPFIDRKYVKVKGGDGGDGKISFTSLFANEFAGPDGGDGGNGGHVVFEASTSTPSLAHLSSNISGNQGASGGPSNCSGANGKNLTIHVPVGTVFREDDQTIADLSLENVVFVGARGGSGGKGNKFFATAQNQSPEICEYGAKGEEKQYLLEMSVIADFGLVGYPNAGKSTLLRQISRARPKVASYAFTTVRPHVGVVFFSDMSRVTVADIPGLLPDASQNYGLGISFLRHIHRCLCLIYVLDFSLPNPMEQYITLKQELATYDPNLMKKQSLLIANKLDLPEAKANYKKQNDPDIIPISGKNGENISNFLIRLKALKKVEEPQETKIYTPVQDFVPNKWRN